MQSNHRTLSVLALAVALTVSACGGDQPDKLVESAKGYMELGGFSHAGLLEQLTSSAGEGFTNAQALYALKKVGL